MKKLPMIILAMLGLLCLGLVYGYSIFVAPLEAEFGWERAQTSLTFSISIIAMCLGIMTGGVFNKQNDKPMVTLTVAAVLLAAGFLVSSMAQQITTFYIAYGACIGFGVGLAYVEIIAIVTKCIPGKQGMLSGILMMCFGLGALILGAICTNLMDVIGWRQTFRFLGIVFAILIVLLGLFLEFSKKKGKDEAGKNITEDHSSFTTKEMLATSDFKLFYIWTILISAAGLALMGHIAPCAMQIGASAGTATFFAGLTSVSNGAGRLIYGTCYDNYGVKKTVNMVAAVFIVAAVIVAAAVTVESIALLAVGCVLIGISFGAMPTSSSALTIRFYGPRFFSSNFGLSSTQLIFAAFIGPYFAGQLYTNTGSYVTTFYGIIGLAVAALIVSKLLLAAAARNGRKLVK